MSRLWWLTTAFCFRLVACFTIRQQFGHSSKSCLQTSLTCRNLESIFSAALTTLHSAAAEPDVSTQLRDHLKGTCIYLVGMMGCGKSTVAECLASKLEYLFKDTDVMIESKIKMPIARYFGQGHEAEFREVEHQVLVQLSQYSHVVVATGGGIVIREKNWDLLSQGVVVHLDLSPEELYKRLITNPIEVTKRPLLQSPDPLAKLRDLNAQRKEPYDRADVKVRVGPQHSPQQTADRVIEALVHFIKQHPPRWQMLKARRDQTSP